MEGAFGASASQRRDGATHSGCSMESRPPAVSPRATSAHCPWASEISTATPRAAGPVATRRSDAVRGGAVVHGAGPPLPMHGLPGDHHRGATRRVATAPLLRLDDRLGARAYRARWPACTRWSPARCARSTGSPRPRYGRPPAASASWSTAIRSSASPSRSLMGIRLEPTAPDSDGHQQGGALRHQQGGSVTRGLGRAEAHRPRKPCTRLVTSARRFSTKSGNFSFARSERSSIKKSSSNSEFETDAK